MASLGCRRPHTWSRTARCPRVLAIRPAAASSSGRSAGAGAGAPTWAKWDSSDARQIMIGATGNLVADITKWLAIGGSTGGGRGGGSKGSGNGELSALYFLLAYMLGQLRSAEDTAARARAEEVDARAAMAVLDNRLRAALEQLEARRGGASDAAARATRRRSL